MSGAVAAGLFGKLPARGDFVRLGLPSGFVIPWDDWLQRVLAGSRDLMGADWLPAWLEAPVWRFALPPGLCGAQAVLGVILPSVDRVGRYFPLTLAAVLPAGLHAPAQEATDPWLDACEAAGRTALEQDSGPDEVAARMPAFPAPGAAEGSPGAVWWTSGGPRVVATRLVLDGLPAPAQFAAMLGGDLDAPVPT